MTTSDQERAAPAQEPVAWQRYGERTGWTDVDASYAEVLRAAGEPVRALVPAASIASLSAENGELRAKLAEARETAFDEAAQIAESAAEYTEEQIARMSVDCFGRVNDSGCSVRLSRRAREIAATIRARAFRDATSEGDAG